MAPWELLAALVLAGWVAQYGRWYQPASPWSVPVPAGQWPHSTCVYRGCVALAHSPYRDSGRCTPHTASCRCSGWPPSRCHPATARHRRGGRWLPLCPHGRCTLAAWPLLYQRWLPQPHAKRHGRGRGCRAPWLAPLPVATHQRGQPTGGLVGGPLGGGQVTAPQERELRVLVAHQCGLTLAILAEQIARAVDQLGRALEFAVIIVMGDVLLAVETEVVYRCGCHR